MTGPEQDGTLSVRHVDGRVRLEVTGLGTVFLPPDAAEQVARGLLVAAAKARGEESGHMVIVGPL